MAPPAIKARLNFLAAAAHLYSSADPATSAQLMLECKTVAASSNIEMKETESSPACVACGTILVSGWTSRKFIACPRRSKKPRPKSRKYGQNMPGVASKLVISKCLVCRRSTKTQVMTATRSGVGRKCSASRPLPSAASLPIEANSEATNRTGQETHKVPSANLNSKKRAQTRRHGGLQAMLEKSKTTESRPLGIGLELMDFMKEA